MRSRRGSPRRRPHHQLPLFPRSLAAAPTIALPPRFSPPKMPRGLETWCVFPSAGAIAGGAGAEAAAGPRVLPSVQTERWEMLLLCAVTNTDWSGFLVVLEWYLEGNSWTRSRRHVLFYVSKYQRMICFSDHDLIFLYRSTWEATFAIPIDSFVNNHAKCRSIEPYLCLHMTKQLHCCSRWLPTFLLWRAITLSTEFMYMVLILWLIFQLK
jgi:hypothetical protein